MSSQEQDGNESENSSLGSQDIGDEESKTFYICIITDLALLLGYLSYIVFIW